MATMLRKLGLLLYKNFLVRKRQWISALIVQILIPCFFFYNLRNIKLAMPDQTKIEDRSYPIESEGEITKMERYFDLYIVPQNSFTALFAEELKSCLNKTDGTSIIRFKTEKDMFDAYEKNVSTLWNSRLIKALVFDENINSFTKQFKYKVYVGNDLPSKPFDDNYFEERRTVDNIMGLQICVDKTFINLNRNSKINVQLSMQKMVKPGIAEPHFGDKMSTYSVACVALVVFLLQLNFEASKASDEKYLGVNVLMAMNGVPNYLNMLSWLLSGLIFSLLYTIPITIILNIQFEDAIPLLRNGNSFIFWLLLTLHAAHLFSFGMHVSAYFTRSKFLAIGLLVIYGGTTALAMVLIKEDPIIPYLGILFPNILLLRACEEVVYYQGTSGLGLNWSNLFKVDNPVYGVAGSLGMMMIFSVLGAILHFTLANYICAINPGKYGTKKHPLYFLEFLTRSNNPYIYEKLEIDNEGKIPFESVSEGAYTPGIQLRGLKKIYNVGLLGNAQVHALKGINIDFYQGQITSLLGHNGAGKSTIMSILTGMISPTEGIVLVNRKNIRDNLDEIMMDMGLCPQENIVFPNLSVYEQFKFFAMLKNKNKSSSDIEANVKSLMEKLKLYEKRNVLPKKLSGGQKRRVCLGMALVGDSNVLILDEPTSGLDPEIRRTIWDILLKMRGEKTILISTHDMEEADILGDRIAIVHSGKLRSYGTSMFLKKLLGRGNMEVTLSTESWCNPETVRTYLGDQSEILNTDGSKMVMSVPNTPELPDALDRIESHKKDLGITGMSVSLITLEQVFLKVTKDEDEVDFCKPLIKGSSKSSGFTQSLHATKGLLYKKAMYTWKNMSTTLLMLALTLLSLFLINLMMNVKTDNDDSTPINFRLDTYNKAKIFYIKENDPQNFADNYKTVVEQFNGKAYELSKGSNITKELLNYGYQNYQEYKAQVISAAEFDTGEARAIYNNIKASYARPISMNLLTNGILKALKGLDYSIEISGQNFPKKKNENETVFIKRRVMTVQSYAVPVILVVLLFPTVALLIIHPLMENVTSIKHLQRMTGLSSFNYWGSMLLFDFFLILILTFVIIVGLVIIDLMGGYELMKSKETLILTALLLLFALSVLPFMYCFTFFIKTTDGAMKMLSLVPTVLVIAEIIIILLIKYVAKEFFLDNNMVKYARPIEKVAVLLTPYIGFFYGCLSFFDTAIKNAACRQFSNIYSTKELVHFLDFCQPMECSKGECKNPREYFGDFEEDVSLELGFLSLCGTAVLYSVLLWVLESKLIPIVIARSTADKLPSDSDADEQVKKVKRSIANEIDDIKTKSSQVVANGIRSTDNIENGVQERHVFLVHELRKKYGSLVAVQDISFGVNESECFGLLGVNGAGKSTTFRMMTGQEIPHHGTMFLNEEELTGFRESHHSQMGYCPQNNAIIRSLNSYDHLRLFARLRGIPEPEVEYEVNKWIRQLNLNACASQPSGTYSGGNKRRLNIAISMIGVPDVVLLDEPTTGVDPAARRSLWNVIKSSQRTTGQAVILTSHSMEECEALCSRLAIMVGGKFVCIGPSQELKQRFGAGYDIQIKLNPEKAMLEVAGIKRDVEASLQCELVDENSGYLMYHVSSSATKWRKMYDVMSATKNMYSSIEDVSVLSSTLEQLFLLFARAANESP